MSSTASETISTVEEDRALVTRIYAPPSPGLRSQLQRAREHVASGRTLLSEIARLAVGPGRLKPQEYFYYRLFEQNLTVEQKREFIGKREQPWIHLACNERSWTGVCHDKLLFYTLMAGLGFPTPRLLALYHDSRKGVPAAQHLRSREDLRRFFETVEVPLFAKPVDGVHSVGSIAIERIEAARGMAVLASGVEVPLERVLDRMEQSKSSGYLIQERVRPHPDLVRLSGPTLSCARIMVLMGREGPELSRTQFKIPVGRNTADNFWRGNMIAAVNPATGAIERVVKGSGFDQTFPTAHPDTGQPLIGAVLPHWADLTRLALDAAPALARIRIQAWDIAIGASGPVLIECNSGGDFSPPQLAWGRGMLDERFRRFLREQGYRGPRPAILIPLAMARAAARKVGLARQRRTSRHL
jgi:hypothetical protein